MTRRNPNSAMEPAFDNHNRWIVSYADFITLLLAVFIVIAASSERNRLKAAEVTASMRAAFERVRPAPSQPVAQAQPEFVPSMQYLSTSLADEISLGKIDLHLEQRGLVVSLREATFFPSGGDRIDENTYPSIVKIAETIRGLRNAVRLEGHSDSLPIHTSRFRSNWELSAARSIAMMELLSGRFGIPRTRMAIAGFADTTPVETNETEAGRARNRRVDIVILSERAALNEPVALAQTDHSLGR